MSGKSQTSSLRAWKEMAGMIAIATLALSCVAAVNHKLKAQLANADSFRANQLEPIPDEPEKPDTVMITSPAAGIFQAGNTTGGPALVKVGMKVKPETILANIQPMDATAIPILAGVSGTVKEIFVEDQSVVRTGEALMKIEVKKLDETPADSR